MNSIRTCAIILDYYGADKTESCLRSLIGQGIDTIFVVDNSAARDASAKIFAAVNRVLGISDFKIEILSPGQNLGFGKGVNFALNYDAHNGSPHDYYLLINNDAVAGPGLVKGLVKALIKHSNIALVSPRIVSSSPEREYGIWYHRYLGLLLSSPARFCFHYYTGCCLLFRRELIRDTGLFDEAFFMYGEDTELAWRLTRQGKSMICANDVYVEHEYGPSVDRTSFFYEYHMARGHLLLSWKTRLTSFETPFLVVAKCLGLFCRAAVRSFRARSLVPLQALFVAANFGRAVEPRIERTH
jgi:N-acetylglucosaminyl-diphospho-decaprenol L-rhamnosyltransferase